MSRACEPGVTLCESGNFLEITTPESESCKACKGYANKLQHVKTRVKTPTLSRAGGVGGAGRRALLADGCLGLGGGCGGNGELFG